jgi:hypothetical protein
MRHGDHGNLREPLDDHGRGKESPSARRTPLVAVPTMSLASWHELQAHAGTDWVWGYPMAIGLMVTIDFTFYDSGSQRALMRR